jgi:predicted transcriptional regulator
MATSLKLDEAMKAAVRHLAAIRDRSGRGVIREPASEYVGREEKREAFRQAGLRAWEAYEQTGLHMTGEEADAWLAKLEAGEDAKIPSCRG